MHSRTSTTITSDISVFIVDDHPIVIDGIQTVIEHQSDFQVCGHASSIQEALELIQNVQPKVLVSDISLNQESGIDLVKEAKNILPNIKILMMSMHDEVHYIKKALRIGANGYISKSDTSSYLIDAIHDILCGELYLTPGLEKKIARCSINSEPHPSQKVDIDKLTKKEKEIFLFIGKGKSTKDISNTLNISPRTVECHKENIKKKLNKYSMNEVLEVAIEWTKVNAD